MIDSIQNESKSEEVQHIIDRMPIKMGFWVSTLVLLLFAMLIVFGCVVRYPDVVSGRVSLSSSSAPLKLIANTYGKLKLMSKSSMQEVKEGELIAYIDNPTSPSVVLFIDSLLKLYNPNNELRQKDALSFPRNVSLGELNQKYYAFFNSLQEYRNYQNDRLFQKKGENLSKLLNEQNMAIAAIQKRIEMAENSLHYYHKFYSRDSILFLKRVISEYELDKTQMNFIASKDALQNLVTSLINSKQSMQQTRGNIEELDIQSPEKEKELKVALVSTYNDIVDNIKSWEQKYVFRSPFNGSVQFLKFYNENQFVQSGEEVFTVVPKTSSPFGEVVLPALGSGKIKLGQEVIIKLDNYPHIEYGTIEGKVKSVSLTTSITKVDQKDMETYLVLVDLPRKLKTNYGSVLDFKAESKGIAEIITDDRRLIDRLFDNLKYAVKK